MPRQNVVPPGQVPPRAGTPPRQVHPRAGTPPGAVHAGRYGQQAGGTHPTGMHSCYHLLLCGYCEGPDEKIDVVNVVHMLARDVFDIAKRRC